MGTMLDAYEVINRWMKLSPVIDDEYIKELTSHMIKSRMDYFGIAPDERNKVQEVMHPLYDHIIRDVIKKLQADGKLHSM